LPDIVPAQRVTWIELFYDVIVAASMLLIYGSLAKHLSWGEFLWLSTVALVTFSMWLSTTLIFNRFPSDTTGRRLFVIAQMIALIYSVASMESSDRVDGDVGIAALGVAMAIMAAMWEFVRRHGDDHPDIDRIPVLSFGIGAIFLLSAVFLPDSLNTVVFLVGALIGFVPIFVMYVPRLVIARVVDVHHVTERLGGLVLIMLGETFLEMAVLFTKGADPRPLGVVLVLMVLTLVWWQYFSFVSGAPRPDSPAVAIGYLLGHAMVVLGLGTSAVSLTEVGLALQEQLPLPVLSGILGGSLALVYAGMALIAAEIRVPISRVLILLVTTVIFAALGVLFWSTWELDEQTLTGVVVLVSLAALLLSALTTKNQSKRGISTTAAS